MDQTEMKNFESFKIWWKNNVYHRDGDLPAVEYANGTRLWYSNGVLHRDGDLPAVEYANGCKEYWKKGKRHRDGDLPAVDFPSGHKEYWKDGIEYDFFRKEKIRTAINIAIDIALDSHPKEHIIETLFKKFKIDPNKMGYSDIESIPWGRNIELYDIAINLIAESIEMKSIT